MKSFRGIDTQLLPSVPYLDRLGDAPFFRAETGAVSFLCCNIASLHKLNRSYGRSVGDALLEAVVQWMQQLSEGELYRIEGDRFCLVFHNTELERIRQYAVEMDRRFGVPWQLQVKGRLLLVFAQAHIAVLEDLDCDYRPEIRDLLDQAMEYSRREQRIAVFDAALDEQWREHARLQIELNSCILSGMQGFQVYYQPIVDPTTSTWKGLEALCRWQAPTLGAVAPDVFIREAEEMGLIHILGDWVLDTALQTSKELSLEKIEGFFVSVNISALQLTKQDYVGRVLRIVQKHDYPCRKLLLEITESTRLTFNEMTYKAVEALRSKGVMLALDDFGAGYSGFSYLKNLPADILKVDREFIENIENDGYLQYFYYIMSETAHASGMKLVAEGVETQEQFRSVTKNGADFIQGYFFGKPMDRDTIQTLRENFLHPLPIFSGLLSGAMDFKHWINSQSAYKITPSLFGLQNRCIDHILAHSNPEDAMNKILETVGRYFKVHHVYVFLRDEGTIFSSRYEWCAEGVAANKHLFQRIDGALDGFYNVLCENDVIMSSSSTQLPTNLRARLEMGNQQETVQSIVSMPMKQQGEILGFVGFDYGAVRQWVPEELIILHSLCLFCLIIIERGRDRQPPASTTDEGHRR